MDIAGYIVHRGKGSKSTSTYADDLPISYQYPLYRGGRRTAYANHGTRLLGRWILIYESGPGRGNFVGVARVEYDRPDTVGHKRLGLEDYIPFSVPVPYKVLYPNLPSSAIVLFQPEHQAGLLRVLQYGMGHTQLPAVLTSTPLAPVPNYRERTKELVSQTVRDQNFRKLVLPTRRPCVFSGLDLAIDGRYEVEAAHIWPVAQHGPDVAENGIPLSRTVHWLFDQYEFTIHPETWTWECKHRLALPFTPQTVERTAGTQFYWTKRWELYTK